MKACQIGILTMGIILPVFLGTMQAEEQKNISVPAQISSFYEDYNFISSYSTTTERRRLIGCVRGEDIPEDLKCQRLKNVLARMKKLRQMILPFDSEMVIWSDLSGSFFGFHFRPVLFIVGEVQISEEKALVEVHSYELEPGMILRFISDYDNSIQEDDDSSSLDERVKVALAMASDLEIHRWSCQKGKWMKSSSDLFFLDVKN